MIIERVGRSDQITCKRRRSSAQMADDFQSMISENGRTQLLESNTGMHPVCKAENRLIHKGFSKFQKSDFNNQSQTNEFKNSTTKNC